MMTGVEKDTKSDQETGGGGEVGSGAATQSSPSRAKDDVNRIGTKVDIRGTSTEPVEEQPVRDKLRDGT